MKVRTVSRMNDEKEELIPVLQVLDDWYADKGIVSWAARDYYYLHYADDNKRKRMDKDEKIQTIIAYIIVFGILLLGIVGIVCQLIGGERAADVINKLISGELNQ